MFKAYMHGIQFYIKQNAMEILICSLSINCTKFEIKNNATEYVYTLSINMEGVVRLFLIYIVHTVKIT